MTLTLRDLKTDEPEVYRALLEFEAAAINIRELFTSRYQAPPSEMRTGMIAEARRCLKVLEGFDR